MPSIAMLLKSIRAGASATKKNPAKRKKVVKKATKKPVSAKSVVKKRQIVKKVSPPAKKEYLVVLAKFPDLEQAKAYAQRAATKHRTQLSIHTV